jgi:amino-acid N-acetyltransferase
VEGHVEEDLEEDSAPARAQNIGCDAGVFTRYCAPVSGDREHGLRARVRRARTSDVPAIKHLVDTYAGKILLEKNLVTLYEAVQEFWVAEWDGEIVGCGALHVMWSDLGEVRTVAVAPKAKGRGIGHAIVERLLGVARDLALKRLFVLTFETEFFAAHGFTEIEGTPVTAEVYEEMCRSYDIGVAEFLDLSYVKPNILGNTRMLLVL